MWQIQSSGTGWVTSLHDTLYCLLTDVKTLPQLYLLIQHGHLQISFYIYNIPIRIIILNSQITNHLKHASMQTVAGISALKIFMDRNYINNLCNLFKRQNQKMWSIMSESVMHNTDKKENTFFFASQFVKVHQIIEVTFQNIVYVIVNGA